MNKLKKIYNLLLNEHHLQGWWPIINNHTLMCEYHTNAPKNESEKFEICIGAVLTQGTQWYPNVVRAIQQLKLGRSFSKEELMLVRQVEMLKQPLQNLRAAVSILDCKRISCAKHEVLAQLIRPAGYFNQKAKKLQLFVSHVQKHGLKNMFAQPLRRLREELLGLWGIGPETADSMILYAAQKPIFVIDAYTRRIFSRLGLCREDCSYDELQQLFMTALPQDVQMFKEYHALIVEHAKVCCTKTVQSENCVLQACLQKNL